jgi:pimeloyl-ACP methyl ester carboxylesterase
MGLAIGMLLGAAGCAGETGAEDGDPAVEAAAPDLGTEHTTSRDCGGGLGDDLLDKVQTLDHFVTVSHGVRVHLRESFTLRSVLRFPHRAILMQSGAIANGASFNADAFNVDGETGYDARDMFARRGFFAMSVDPEGVGESTAPTSGFDVTYARDLADMTAVVQYVRLTRGVSRVDLLGESDGGGVFSELCARDDLTRSCTMSTMLYQSGTDFFNETFGSPGFQQFILSLPNGYFDTVADNYDILLAGSDPAVSAWYQSTQPGAYAMGTTVANFSLPSYDPTRARVPGLVIRGEDDQNFPLSDTQALAAAYGSAGGVSGGAELVVIPGALQIPRLEPSPHHDEYWDAVVAFVDP